MAVSLGGFLKDHLWSVCSIACIGKKVKTVLSHVSLSDTPFLFLKNNYNILSTGKSTNWTYLPSLYHVTKGKILTNFS